MISKSNISQIINAQRKNVASHDLGLKRASLYTLPDISSHALIVSGIRRCGKSTLLFQLLNEKYPDALYLNFEDPRLYEFEVTDYTRLDSIIADSYSKVLLFDEIQIKDQWELYVRQKLDEKYKVIVTGSNASLLNRELSTKLTGRHITKELFPFSFKEYCSFLNLPPSQSSILKYIKTGGFPEYVKEQLDEILNQLLEDILVRDIAIRYGVRDVKALKRLALYLISNIGKPITASRLKSIFDLGATSTVMEYFSHLEYSYLIYFVPRFSYSIRKQLVNPRKVYAIDTGLVQVNTQSFTEDYGRKLENLIYIHLRRKNPEIYYFRENGECDFLIYEKGSVKELIQVCFELNQDNLSRELSGIYEAMEYFNLTNGTIVTINQHDQFVQNVMTVDVVPAHEFIWE